MPGYPPRPDRLLSPEEYLQWEAEWRKAEEGELQAQMWDEAWEAYVSEDDMRGWWREHVYMREDDMDLDTLCAELERVADTL